MKPRSLILSLLFCLIFFSILRAEITVKGRVISTMDQPVSQAQIICEPGNQTVLTDEQGYFSLSLPDYKNYKIRIRHRDYFEQEFAVSKPKSGKLLTFTLVPYIPQKEEIVVTATRFPEPITSVPAASSVLTTTSIEEKMPSHITELVQTAPGVSSLGTGGFSVVPSIRGLARRRILLLIDNSRLSSDRRTGPNASFLNPEDLEKIEVLRSPSSVYYGSEAIGGVLNFLTYTPPAQDHFKLKGNLKYGTVNNEREVSLAVSGAKSGLGYYFSVRTDKAENYRSPSAEVPQSQFTQTSIFGKIIKWSEKREISASFLLARGSDIGKPSITSETKPTWYPAENQNLFQFNWKEKSLGRRAQLNFHFYLNPNFLETRSDKIEIVKTQESFARTESTDYGLQLSLEYPLAKKLRLTGGADLYGRSRSKAYNQYINFDGSGNVTETIDEYPYTGGKRTDSGLFLSLDYEGIKNLDITGGLRLDFLSSRANPGGEEPALTSQDQALTGFLAASYRLFNQVSIFANYSRAYRAPDLNERFYTGITGRGFIIANPDLKNECSQNFDTGIKLTNSRIYLGLFGFIYRIDNLVERYKIGNQLYTYGNVEQGKIKGLELEWEYFPFSRFSVFGNYYLYDGQSQVSGNPLNDIPPQRLVIGGKVWFNRFNIEVNGLIQAKKGNPGPAEIAIPGYGVVNFKASYILNQSLRLYARINNLFNKFYLARPDPDSREEPRRNLVLGLSFSY